MVCWLVLRRDEGPHCKPHPDHQSSQCTCGLGRAEGTVTGVRRRCVFGLAHSALLVAATTTSAHSESTSRKQAPESIESTFTVPLTIGITRDFGPVLQLQVYNPAEGFFDRLVQIVCVQECRGKRVLYKTRVNDTLREVSLASEAIAQDMLVTRWATHDGQAVRVWRLTPDRVSLVLEAGSRDYPCFRLDEHQQAIVVVADYNFHEPSTFPGSRVYHVWTWDGARYVDHPSRDDARCSYFDVRPGRPDRAAADQ